MEYLSDIIQTTLQSFDFAYCIAVNVLTYLIIKLFDNTKEKKLSVWQKRIVLIVCTIILGIVYYFIGTEPRLLVNSAILAPVSWSWIIKPICAKFNIDYKQFNG